MKPVRRLKKQGGYLFQRCGTWLGRYRQYDAHGKAMGRCISLGRVAEMSEAEAKVKLGEHIAGLTEQRPILHRIGLSGAVEGLAPEGAFESKMRTQGKGAVSELLVAADLTRKGMYVFRAIDSQAICDLIVADSSGRLMRVEVKTVCPNSRGVVLCDMRRNLGKFDLAAFVFETGRIIYREAREIKDDRYPLGKLSILHTPCETGSTQVVEEIGASHD